MDFNFFDVTNNNNRLLVVSQYTIYILTTSLSQIREYLMKTRIAI
jgi:hypothetical protein